MTNSDDGNGPDGQTGIIGVILDNIKKNLGPIDAVIDQCFMQICRDNEISNSLVKNAISSVVTSWLIIIFAYVLYFSINAVPVGLFVEKFLQQNFIVVVSICMLLPIFWTTVLIIIAHTREISMCEAASRGMRLTLYVIFILYIISWAAT
jgi:hypothetical protein